MNFIIAKFGLFIFLINCYCISVTKSDSCAFSLNLITQQDTENCNGYFALYGKIYVQEYCPGGTKYSAQLGCCVFGKCPPCNCEQQNKPIRVVTSNPACDSTIFTTDDGTTTISVSYSTTESVTTTDSTDESSASTTSNDSTTEESSISTDESSTVISTTEWASTTDSIDESSASTTEESSTPTEVSSTTISTTASATTTDFTDESTASTISNDSTTEEPSIPTEVSSTTISTTSAAITTDYTAGSSASTTTTESSSVSTGTSSTATTPISSSSTTTAAPIQPVSCLNVATGTFLPDPQHCSQYYVCVYGDAVHMYCPAGLWIDIPQQICNYPQFVNCAANRD